ncbi:Uu.00g008170.m01.CDS01 [Anthostomella pinea]|uniref:Uu.00g008170.m01.CDS01 n=1 Tax=Anthostomella pinea TaxID=933095 RepID=A0AAI8VX58_9PEZI|nr:Uu.00g008170.m01.CDS01 [Anthostomella pinea]
MAIKFVHHKGFDNKPRPIIFYFTPTRKLIFCPVSLIIGIALDDCAFDAPSVVDASSVMKVKPLGPMQCILLRWKESMRRKAVFRRIKGAELSDGEAMTYAKLRDDMGEQSLNAGFEERWTPKFCKRGAGNTVNGDALDSIRDQMMRHDPNQNAFLEKEKQVQLFKLFAHVSIWRDPHAVRDMVPEDVWSNLPPGPEISELKELRAKLKGGQHRLIGNEHKAKIHQLTYTISLKRTNRNNLVVKKYREDYFHNGPIRDIERQA